jgi:hypothetical protein
MKEWSMGECRVFAPATIEEMLFAVGEKERDVERVEIILSSELVADLCVRLIRLEDERKEDE